MPRKKHNKALDVPNPFVNQLIISTKWLLEVKEGFGKSYQSREIDIEQYVKIFPKLMEYLIESSQTARVVLHYIMTRVEGAEFDYIELHYSKVGLAKSSFYKAIEELTLKQVIKSRKEVRMNTYWLNPSMLFRGDRVKQYPDRTQPVNLDPLLRVKSSSPD